MDHSTTPDKPTMTPGQVGMLVKLYRDAMGGARKPLPSYPG